jgi:hypothetical protein
MNEIGLPTIPLLLNTTFSLPYSPAFTHTVSPGLVKVDAYVTVLYCADAVLSDPAGDTKRILALRVREANAIKQKINDLLIGGGFGSKCSKIPKRECS